MASPSVAASPIGYRLNNVKVSSAKLLQTCLAPRFNCTAQSARGASNNSFTSRLWTASEPPLSRATPHGIKELLTTNNPRSPRHRMPGATAVRRPETDCYVGSSTGRKVSRAGRDLNPCHPLANFARPAIFQTKYVLVPGLLSRCHAKLPDRFPQFKHSTESPLKSLLRYHVLLPDVKHTYRTLANLLMRKIYPNRR